MSGIVNKIKEVLHKDSSDTTHGTSSHGTNNPNSNVSSVTSGSTNHGGHNSNLANKADPRIDSDRDGSRIPGAAGHSGVSNTHGSGLTGNNHSGLTSGSTNHGPHDSNLANKADPRIDSDHSHTHSNTLGTSNHGTTGGLGSNHNTTGYGSSTTHGSTNAGPHDSNVLNKMDPRVDSDRDGSNRHTGTTGTGIGSNTHGTGYGSNTHNTGIGSSNTGYGSGSTNHGPHSTNTANVLDPRVDSDRSSHGIGQNNQASHFGTNTGHSATHGSTNNGPHNSNMANVADPRVDSDHSKTGAGHTQSGGVFGASGSHATSGSGTAQNTSGPHNSDLLNKLDPRVDSDKDGSKTYGGNQTHA